MAEFAPILVVDDHPNIRAEIYQTLNAAGFRLKPFPAVGRPLIG